MLQTQGYVEQNSEMQILNDDKRPLQTLFANKNAGIDFTPLLRSLLCVIDEMKCLLHSYDLKWKEDAGWQSLHLNNKSRQYRWQVVFVRELGEVVISL